AEGYQLVGVSIDFDVIRLALRRPADGVSCSVDLIPPSAGGVSLRSAAATPPAVVAAIRRAIDRPHAASPWVALVDERGREPVGVPSRVSIAVARTDQQLRDDLARLGPALVPASVRFF